MQCVKGQEGVVGSPRLDTALDLGVATALSLWLSALLFRGVPVLSFLALGAVLAILRVVVRRTTPCCLRLDRGSVVLLAGTVVFCLAIVEGGARIMLPAEGTVHADYLISDPVLVYRHKPKSHVLHKNPLENGDFDQIHVDISSQGLRDREIGPKQPGELRILVLGDSFTFGSGLEAKDTLSSSLERALKETYPDRTITVMNGGVQGYGPWQEAGFLQEIGFPLQPDLVIFQTFPTNDLSDSLFKIGKYLRAYDTDAMERIHAFRFKDLWHVRVQRWVRTHSRAYQALVRITHRENLLADLLEQCRFVRPMTPLVLPPRENREFDIEVSLRQWYPELEESWRLYQEDVLALRSLCQEHGVAFIGLCIPAIHVYYDTSWHRLTAPAGEHAYERGKEVHLVEAFFAQEGIPYVSVFDALGRVQNPLAVYFPINRHLTPAGTRLVANRIRDYLIKYDIPQKLR